MSFLPLLILIASLSSIGMQPMGPGGVMNGQSRLAALVSSSNRSKEDMVIR